MTEQESKELSPEDQLWVSIFGEKPIREQREAGDIEPTHSNEVEQGSYQLLREQVEEVLNSLTERERKVMYLRFGLDDGQSRTLTEVGQEIGRSRWTAGRIERRALRKLRHPSRTKTLRDYLE